MSTAPPPPPSRGATPVDDARAGRRRVRWLVLIAAVLVAVAAVLLLSRCDGSTNKSTTPANAGPTSVAATEASSSFSSNATPTSLAPSATTSIAATEAPPTATPTATAATPLPAGPAATNLTANGTDLLPLSAAAGAGGDLSRYIGQSVTARSVLVQSVPADNGFWVGTSPTDRVWVQLLQRGQVSPHPVRTGDHVSFTGTMVANPAGFAQSADVDAADGAAQLTAEQAHIETNKSSLTFTP